MPCVLGNEPCEHFRSTAQAPAEDAGAGHGLPWSGLALGSADLVAVGAVARLHLVGVVGAANAGKTTSLAAHWIAARRGQGRFGSRFAGSYTLLGWHQIARHLQWNPWGRGFPPHTTAVDRRTPALLHVAYTTEHGAPAHVAFTDVPGEWYREWAYDANAAPGANWIADNADAFVILSDSEALSGPDRGEARGDYEALASRLSAAARGRPVLAVRTKADLEIADPVRQRIEEINSDRFGVETLCVSVHENPDRPPLTDAIDLVTAAVTDCAPAQADAWARSIADEADGSADPLLRFGARRVT